MVSQIRQPPMGKLEFHQSILDNKFIFYCVKIDLNYCYYFQNTTITISYYLQLLHSIYYVMNITIYKQLHELHVRTFVKKYDALLQYYTDTSICCASVHEVFECLKNASIQFPYVQYFPSSFLYIS
jgi:hypothetical protein